MKCAWQAGPSKPSVSPWLESHLSLTGLTQEHQDSYFFSLVWQGLQAEEIWMVIACEFFGEFFSEVDLEVSCQEQDPMF